jgi:hypothetical protein
MMISAVRSRVDRFWASAGKAGTCRGDNGLVTSRKTDDGSVKATAALRTACIRHRYPELSAVAVAQSVEPLVVVQVVVGSSPIRHPLW